MSSELGFPAPPPECRWEVRQHDNPDYYSVILKHGSDTVAIEGIFVGAWGEDHYRKEAAVAARRILNQIDAD